MEALSHTVSPELAAKRMAAIRAGMQLGFTDEKIPEALLKEVCSLSLKAFGELRAALPKVDWSTRRGYFAARFGETLDVTVPLTPIHSNLEQKTGMFGYKILFSGDATVVKQVFCLTTNYATEEKRRLVDQEIALRISFNRHVPKFPKLEQYGPFSNQMLLIDECYQCNLEELQQRQPDYFTEATVCDLLIDILEGVVLLHEDEFVHCDLKKKNIIVTFDTAQKRWRAAVTDLGLTIKKGIPGDTRGTPIDCPPEIFKHGMLGAPGWDKLYYPQNDMWPLGMIAYELLHQISIPSDWNAFKQKQGELFLAKQAGTKKDAELIREFAGAARAFEQQAAEEHPTLTWLHDLLKVDPLRRKSAKETLQRLKAYRQTLPEKCPPLPYRKVVPLQLGKKEEIEQTLLLSEYSHGPVYAHLIAQYVAGFFQKLGEWYRYYFPATT